MYSFSTITGIVTSFLLLQAQAAPITEASSSQVTVTEYVAITVDDGVPAFPPATITGAHEPDAATVTEYVIGFVDKPLVFVVTTVTDSTTTYETTIQTEL